MMSVINDVKRNTDGVLTFDGTTTSTSGSPLKFFYTMLDENSKYLNASIGFTAHLDLRSTNMYMYLYDTQ